MIFRVFLYGMLFAFLAFLVEGFLLIILSSLFIFQKLSPFFQLLVTLFYIFFGVAFVEEFFKYLVVKKKVISQPEFDEPVDALIYLITAALGFAAFENFLILFSFQNFFLPQKEIIYFFDYFLNLASISIFRFLSATFLHALVSGIVGYFLALAFFQKKKYALFWGLSIATFLHGLYNFSIIKIEGNLKFLVPGFILISLTFLLFRCFKELKNKINTC
jgi:RsiW-degrading membrane proteinase PrsW (M82 family)